MTAKFGPAGNSDSFRAMGYRKTDQVPEYIRRMGLDAYEAAGVPLPADLEEYSTRSGVVNSVPDGTQFAYDDQGNYCAQFTQEDGQICYYVLLKGTDAYGCIFLTAPEESFDAAQAALWLSGSQLL